MDVWIELFIIGWVNMFSVGWVDVSTIIDGSCMSMSFVASFIATNVCTSRQNYVCRNKTFF